MNLEVYNEVFVLFLIVGAGYFARKRGMIDGQFNRGLVGLLLNITLPLLIIVSFNFKFQPETLNFSVQIFFASILIHVSLFFLSRYFFWHTKSSVRRVLRFSSVFSNCAFMGYPILHVVYGKVGVFYGSIFSAPFNIGVWTLGVLIFEDEYDRKTWIKALLNPGVLAVFVGIILVYFSIDLPYPLQRSFELLGSSTTPLAMVLVGSMLAEIHLKEILSGFTVYYISALRLIAIPATTFAIFYLAGLRGTPLGVITISVAMPIAASTAAFAERYGCEKNLASRCVFVSTLISIITIPIVIAVVSYSL